MPPTDEQAGPRPAIRSHDWLIIRLLLQNEPRKSAVGIYNQVMQPGHPGVPADFHTSDRWEGICARLRTAAAIGDAEPTLQQSEHLLSVVDEAADEFNKALEESLPSGRSRKRKPDAAAGPTPKRQNMTKRKRVYASWDEIRAPLDSLLALINREIAAWLVEEHHLPLWAPPEDSSWNLPEYHAALERVISMHLPRTPAAASGVCLPDLLLYKLGESEELDPGFAKKKNKVKAGNAHQVIANVSGAGKTRLSLEVLADDWSFYFTADYNSVVNPYGSQDIKTALLDLAYSTDAEGNSFRTHVQMTRGGDSVHPIEGVRMGETNAEMAQHIFAAVALARVLVHSQFLDVYNRLPSDLRARLPGPKLWLLLQVCPILKGRDIFVDVYRILKDLSVTDLEIRITECLVDWSSVHHSIARVAIDEVQHLVDAYPCAFVGTMQKRVIPTRPVFKPLVNTLASCFLTAAAQRTRFLLAGTQLCVADAFKAVVSTAVKNAVVVESSVTAAHFDRKAGTSEFDPAPIVRYLSHFLTSEIVTSFGDLLRDIVFWLRGRPRFLACFVQWVLQKGPNAARAVLMNIVSKLTDVELDICAAPGAPVSDFAEMQLRPLLSSTLMRENENLCTKDGTITDSCRTIVRALLNLLIEGRYTRIDYSHAKLVELLQETA